MLILNAEEVRQALPMDQTISAMKDAYAALSDGRAEVPLRARLPIDIHQGVSLFMPAYVQDQAGESLAVKIVSVFPENASLNLPIIHAAVLVLDSGTGRILALLEGGTLTAIRTGAGCSAAADLLARPDSRVAAIFGAGVQSRTQLEAICTVRPIETVWVYSPSQTRVKEFIAEMAGQGSIPKNLSAASTPQQAIADADIICAATTSSIPVFDDADLKPGVHINAAGSYTPEMQEIPSETIQRALVTVDSRDSVLAETGDLIQPIQNGLINADHIHAEIGEIVLGRKPGRQDDQQITYFKSVGVAVQDALAGHLALDNAVKFSLGHHIDW
jgi:ornithine cyclodeaminase